MPSKEHLAFESQTPSFLRRLRGELPSDQSLAADPHRHSTPQVRAKKARNPHLNADGEDEDEPVYLDAETGDVLAGAAVRDLAAGTTGSATGMEMGREMEVMPERGSAGLPGLAPMKALDGSAGGRREIAAGAAGVGMARRKGQGPRVVGGVVGAGGGDDEVEEAIQTTAKRKGNGDEPESATADAASAASSKPKGRRKGKKIKLSFDDNET